MDMTTNMMKKWIEVTHIEGGKILVIDDDQDILDSIYDVLTLDNKYQVYTAANTSQALIEFNKNSPDIAIIDIKIGNENGLDLLPILKNINPNVSCIMLTAYRNVDYAINAIENNVDSFLLKPVNTEKLLDLLENTRISQYRNSIRAKYSNQLNDLLEESSDLFFLLNQNGILLNTTNASLDLFGLCKEELLGMDLAKFKFWENPDITSNKIRLLIRTALKDGKVKSEMMLH